MGREGVASATLRDAGGRGFMRFEPFERDILRITIEVGGERVRQEAPVGAACDGLVEFFQLLVRKRMGWPGIKKWNNGASGLAMKAKHEAPHVALAFQIGPAGKATRFKGELRLTFEEVEGAAGALAAFLASPLTQP